MFVKFKNVKVSRISFGKVSSALKSHLKYIQYRERDEGKETSDDRYLFDHEHNSVDRKDAHTNLMTEPAGYIYYHRIILSPADNEPVTDWRQWTSEVMNDLAHQD